jgi:hypothetical protein
VLVWCSAYRMTGGWPLAGLGVVHHHIAPPYATDTPATRDDRPV